MPWKESNHVNERMKFIVRLEEGESMTSLCEEFEISRKTGYKIWNRFQTKGLDGLLDESRRPFSNPLQTSETIAQLILNLKAARPTWGAIKLREYLLRKHANIRFPSRNTFHNILVRNSLVKSKKRIKYKATGTNLRSTQNPNDLWCADFKGQFRLRSKRYCYPLTISDHRSRYLIKCVALENTKTAGAFAIFEDAFEEYGLPHAIRTDNGPPFSCPNALLGFSQLSVWWLRLGIEIERIRPGKPQENGRHERLHLTLKQDLLDNPAGSFIKQQEVFDHFIEEYNFKRPHAALDHETPSSVFKHSKIIYRPELGEIEYPQCEKVKRVFQNGKINFKPKKSTHLCTSLIGQNVGLKEVEESLWRVQFLDIVLGHYDASEDQFSPMREIVRI